MYVPSDKEDQELAATYLRAEWIIPLKAVCVNCWDLGMNLFPFPCTTLAVLIPSQDLVPLVVQM